MENIRIQIKETTEADLNNVALLWNNGDVMRYVGFPNGLNVTAEELKSNWLTAININDKCRHYSIYHTELGYCGESYYGVNDNCEAALDIKLLPYARGKGIAYEGLYYAITRAFEQGNAKAVYVDPHRDNKKALALYKKLGFKENFSHPNNKCPKTHVYLEMSEEDFNK